MLIAAAAVVFVLGLLHSVLGEMMIFRHLAGMSGLPRLGFPPMLRADAANRTLRACWHLLTILGWTCAAILARLAALPALGSGERFIVHAMAISFGACAVCMGAGTRGRHVGWIAFLAAAILCGLS